MYTHLESLLNSCVSTFQALSRDMVEQREFEDDYRTFNAVMEQATAAIDGIDLLPIMAQGERPSAVLVASLLAELRNLGEIPIGNIADDPSFGAYLDALLGDIAAIDAMDTRVRCEMFANEPEIAALAVGVHMARHGEGNPFAFAPWSSMSLHQSVLAAAVTAAAVDIVRHAIDATSVEQGRVDAATETAIAAYQAIKIDEFDDIVGFGGVSQVVEAVLAGANDLGVEDADIHRLSGRLMAAYLSGISGVHTTFTDPVPAAQRIIEAAGAVGVITALHFAQLPGPERVVVH